jgi:hypothetical protein
MGTLKFSTGLVALKPTGSNQLPVQLGLLTDLSVDFSQEKILVYGQKKAAIDSYDGKLEIKGSAKCQQWGAQTYAALINGGTIATGSKIGILDEQFTVPTTPFQATVANGATFLEDLGVFNVTSGLYMSPVASGPTTGQYAYSAAGVYTFASADAGNVVRISYSYTAAAVGKTFSYVNALMGQSQQFILSAYNTNGTKKFGYRFGAALFDKLGVGWKLGAIGDASLSFQAIEDLTTGKPFEVYEPD